MFGMQAIETGVSVGASKATVGLLKMKSLGQSEIANRGSTSSGGRNKWQGCLRGSENNPG